MPMCDDGHPHLVWWRPKLAGGNDLMVSMSMYEVPVVSNSSCMPKCGNNIIISMNDLPRPVELECCVAGGTNLIL